MDERRQVLCVEDNDANFALMQRVLESTGRWRVDRAARVDQARAWLEHHTPAVVLLDLDLPGVSGLVLAREIKSSERLRGVPIVVVSASVMLHEQERAREAGCEYFVEKPFDIDSFRAVVAEAAGG